jgi:hypothetical protein
MEIRTVTTLRSKRAEISASIALYERRLAQARADLAHVTACIAIFEASGEGEDLLSYVDTHRMFARGEMIRLCKESLANGPKTTKGACSSRHGGEGARHRRQGASARYGAADDPCAAPAMATRAGAGWRKGEGR